MITPKKSTVGDYVFLGGGLKELEDVRPCVRSQGLLLLIAAEELDAVVGEVVGRLRREEHDARDATRVGGRRRVGETGEGCGSGGGRDRRVGATTRARWDATYRRADRSALALSDRSRLNDPSSLSPRPNPAGLGGRLIARGVRSAARWSVCWTRRRYDESLDLVT